METLEAVQGSEPPAGHLRAGRREQTLPRSLTLLSLALGISSHNSALSPDLTQGLYVPQAALELSTPVPHPPEHQAHSANHRTGTPFAGSGMLAGLEDGLEAESHTASHRGLRWAQHPRCPTPSRASVCAQLEVSAVPSSLSQPLWPGLC